MEQPQSEQDWQRLAESQAELIRMQKEALTEQIAQMQQACQDLMMGLSPDSVAENLGRHVASWKDVYA